MINERLKLAALLVTLTSCMTPTPELTRRYSSIAYDPPSQIAEIPAASISVFSLPTPSPEEKAKSVLDLSDRGQSKFVTVAAAKTESASDLSASIFKPFEPNRAKDVDRSKVVLNRRLVFSLQNENLHSADRIEEAVTSVQMPHDIRFVSWNQFENRYKTIKPGTLELEKKNTTSIEGSLSFPQVKELGEISVKQDQSRGLKETASLERDIVQFWARLQDRQATIFQKGAGSIDLSGTFTIDAVFAFKDGHYDQMDSLKLSNLIDKEGQPQPLEKIVSAVTRVQYARQACDVKADLDLRYRIRKVGRGADTHIESDDEVTMISRAATQVVGALIIPGRELELNVWYINAPIVGDNQLKWQKLVGQDVEAISFTSFDDAVNFLRWLKLVRQKPQHINRRPIGIGGSLQPLTDSNVANLFISLDTPNKCAPTSSSD
jgi:hypothetical protein